MTTTLTIAEVLDALAKAQERGPVEGEDVPPNTFTGPQIRDAMQWGNPLFTRQMRKWLDDGTCRVVPVRRYAIDGRLLNTRGYQFVVDAPRKTR